MFECSSKTLLIILATLVLTNTNYPAVFSLSWLSGYCEDQAQNHRQLCGTSLVQLWDNQSHTIHGLWPGQVSPRTYGSFNISLFQNEIKLLDDMHNYWPPKIKASSSNVFLWDHEWSTHGKDYADIVYSLRPEDFPGTDQERNAALQLTFFKDIIVLYKTLNVQKLTNSSFTRHDYASKLGISQNNLMVVCYKNNSLVEARVCYDITRDGLKLGTCQKQSQSCSQQGAIIDLSNLKFKGQRRVFDYPISSQLYSY